MMTFGITEWSTFQLSSFSLYTMDLYLCYLHISFVLYQTVDPWVKMVFGASHCAFTSTYFLAFFIFDDVLFLCGLDGGEQTAGTDQSDHGWLQC